MVALRGIHLVPRRKKTPGKNFIQVTKLKQMRKIKTMGSYSLTGILLACRSRSFRDIITIALYFLPQLLLSPLLLLLLFYYYYWYYYYYYYYYFFFFNRHCNPCGFWPAQLSLNVLSRKVFTECRCQRHVKPPTWRTSD